MARINTFPVTVDGVGTFVCRRRTFGVQLEISAAYNRLVKGEDNVIRSLAVVADMMSYLSVMVVEAPKGWAPLDSDPDSVEDGELIGRVYDAIRAAEDRFLGRGVGDAQASGAGAGEDGGVVVSGSLPPDGE